jgi:hypothetical protein
MRHPKLHHALVFAAFAISACDTQGQSNPMDQKGKATASEGRAATSPATTKPETSSSGATAAGEPEKQKRGNTPPGQDRAGQGPAAGAIADPTGTATK